MDSIPPGDAGLGYPGKTYGASRLQDEFEDSPDGLRKSIRPHDRCYSQMEIRAPWSS
jgi:hypothetical protein